VNSLAAVVLGILQGLTEFLPVSSSAHLILARAFFGWDVPDAFGLAFDVALHVGTLAAIFAYFRADVLAMARAVPAALDPATGDRAGRLLQRIAVGTLPVVVVGLSFNDFIEHSLRIPAVAAAALAVGGAAMFVAERFRPQVRGEDTVGWLDAVLIGCAQASALIPGISRSGATITIGMFLGLRRDAAARFTFLLAIPAMVAAGGKEALELRSMGLTADSLWLMLIGALVSAVVGYLTIKYFLRFLAARRLDVFVYYRWALAAATLVWLFQR
jgi:undecaprenyl-diphosphatase